MRRPLARLGVVALSLAWSSAISEISARGESAPARLTLAIGAGGHDRDRSPVRVVVSISTFGEEVVRALKAGPVALSVEEADSPSSNAPLPPIEATRTGEGAREVELTWILPSKLAAKTTRKIAVKVDRPAESATSPWTLAKDGDGRLALKRGDRPVFRYNNVPVLAEGAPEVQRRGAYLHPVHSPKGTVVTGDFSKGHTHHRGIFLAYTKMKVEGEEVDLWNIQDGKGLVVNQGLSEVTTGPVTARFSASNRWQTGKKVAFLDETWNVEVYDVSGSPYWLFDVTSTQTALVENVELIPYRYGGMAYRAPDSFQKSKLDVLTSEGRGRVDGDQKPARWVDLTGRIAEDGADYLGAMIADHPRNVNHPTVARIHPTTVPFFSYVPSHEKHNRMLRFEQGRPKVFRYRVLIHDGHPDRDRDESVWLDFAEPPTCEAVRATD